MPVLCHCGYGFSETLPKDQGSVWLDNTWFTEESRNNIKKSLVEEAMIKFDTPPPVLEQMIEAMMSSRAHISMDGYWIRPERPMDGFIFIPHHDVQYFFHKTPAFDFFQEKIAKIIDARKKALNAEKEESKVERSYEIIKNDPHFLTAFAKVKQTFKNQDPLELWRENLTFALEGTDEVVKAVQKGTFKFMFCE